MAEMSQMTFSNGFFTNANFCIFIEILLKFVPRDQIKNKSALV